MSINILCPRCQAPFFLPDSVGGKQVRCSRCRMEFPVPPAAPGPAPVPAVSEQPRAEVPARSAAEQITAQPPKQPISLFPDSAPPPLPSTRRRPGRAERPERKAKSGSSALVLVLVGMLILGALALLPCVGIVGYFVMVAEPQPVGGVVALVKGGAIQPAPAPDLPPVAQPGDFIEPKVDVKDFFPPVKEPPRTNKRKKKNFPPVDDRPRIDPGKERFPPVKDPPPAEKKRNDPPPVEKPPPLPVPDRSKVPIVPLRLEKERIVHELPATIGDLCIGGGGRFVLCSLPKLRKIALFDVNEAKVVHYFPCADDNAAFAAGMTKLVMAFPNTGIMQRWDLVSRQKELTVNVAGAVQTKALLMGSASEGPLLVVGSGRGFVDIRSFKPYPVKEEQQGFGGFGGSAYRISADGTCFGCWEPSLSPQGLRIATLRGFTLRTHYQHRSFGHIIPGPNGEYIYTSRGIFTSEGRPIGKATENAQSLYTIPAAEGDYYLNLPLGNGELYKTGFTVHLAGDERPLVRVPYDMADFARGPGASGTDAFNHWDREPFGNDKRILLFPTAKLMVIIPFTNDRIVVKRFDIDEAIEKSGIDYLLVTSRPPGGATPGNEFTYQVAVKSKKGGVKYKLDAGPDGMQVTPQGLVRWRVPADQPSGEVNVILTVSDSAGQETFHTFKLRVNAAGP